MAIGFKSNGQPHTLEEGGFTREEKDNSVIDNQTIQRLMEFRKTLNDSISASVLDSYIELFASGIIDISFDSVTGEPIAELIKSNSPQFIIRQPSLMSKDALPGLDSLTGGERKYIN